jgi:hypothetical protein
LEHSMKDLILVLIGLVMGTAAFSPGGSGAWSRRSAETSSQQSSGPADGRASSPAGQKTGTAASVPPATRGKKLILKDGNFQLVRSYERRGEKVRYLSAERGDWEEVPAALVDWEATAQAEAADEKAESELVKNVHRQEAERQAQVPLDVDASLRVGSGVFLPSGEGMFAVQGKAVSAMEQVGAQTKTDKKRVIEQVISPVKIVPSKKNVMIAGAKAKLRLSNQSEPLEFFLREAPLDPEQQSPIILTGNAGDSGPDVQLMRVTVKGDKRQMESITAMFGQKIGEKSTVVALQRWDVAPSVYRFTLGESLSPGEYVLAQILPDGLNMFVWDFGVDTESTKSPSNHGP